MDMTGAYRISAPRQKVWEALNDPEVLKACIPGCESLEKTGNEMTAVVVAKIGPVKAKFAGNVRLENANPPTRYSIVGEGQGGVAGFAKGGADVILADDGDGTILQYTAKAQVGGKLAQLGSRLIDGAAKMMADQFFSAFSERLGGQVSPVSQAAMEAGAAGMKEGLLEQALHEAEAKVEMAAIKSGPSGPVVWGLVALAAVAAGLIIANL